MKDDTLKESIYSLLRKNDVMSYTLEATRDFIDLQIRLKKDEQ